MNELLTSPPIVAACLLTAAGGLLWWRRGVRRERERLRGAGYRLIHALKAYSAWLELLRGEPAMSVEPEQFAAARALRDADAIAQTMFPQLAPPMQRLLQGDRNLMAYLWRQRLVGSSAPAASHRCDHGYCQIRDAQEDLIGEIITRCRMLLGEHGQPWRATEIGSEFFNSVGLSTSS